MKAIIRVHSFVAEITNSSTELFVLDSDKSLEFIKQIVEEKEKEFPCSYNGKVFVRKDNPYSYGGTTVYDIDETLKYLRAIGYKIETPEVEIEPEAIIISCERGCMHPEFKRFIEEYFNTEVTDY